MPSKYRTISDLASSTARSVTSSAGRYMAFLTTAANNHKYSFRDQLLIHAQKPDATACAELETWNRLGRWVNRYTKGIALVRMFLQHFLKKSSHINGLRVVTQRYLPLKTE